MQEVSPTRYRIGDIVEVQVSFAVFPMKEAKYKMALILRAIALLDHAETDVSQIFYYINKLTFWDTYTEGTNLQKPYLQAQYRLTTYDQPEEEDRVQWEGRWGDKQCKKKISADVYGYWKQLIMVYSLSL